MSEETKNNIETSFEHDRVIDLLEKGMQKKIVVFFLEIIPHFSWMR